MKRTRKLLLIIVSVMFVGAAVACSSKSSTSEATTSGSKNGEKIELRFLHKWPDPKQAPYFEEVAKEFESKHPNIKVKIEAVADQPMKDKLRVIMGGGDVPDIVFSWSGEFARKFVRSGAALDLTPYLEKDPEWKKSFIPAALQPYVSNGKNYGIPLFVNAKYFVYSKEIFDKYNLKKPQTWDEFLNVLETLKKGGETPILLGNKDSWPSIHYITGLNEKMVPAAELEKDREIQTATFTDPGYVKALEYLQNLSAKKYFNDNVNSNAHDVSSQLFYAKKGAIIYKEIVEFQEVQNSLPGDWDFFAMPAIPEGKGDQNYITGAPEGFIVSSKSKHPDEAVEFLKFLLSKPSAQKLVAKLGWSSSIVGANTTENSLPQLVEGLKLMEGAKGMIEWLDTDLHAKIAEVYLANIQLLLDGQKSPVDIMKEVQAVADEVKKEVQ